MTELTTLDAWKDLWAAQKSSDAGPLLIFKKSPICPTSLAAEDEFNSWVSSLSESNSCQVVVVDVVNARPISLQIATDTGVTHQSPQALLVVASGVIRWDASHSTITKAQLQQAVQSI